MTRNQEVAVTVERRSATHLPLVGRRSELLSCASALDRAEHGAGSALFISGAAGIGKTRLATEIVDEARRRGFVGLTGSGHLLEDDLAYAPLLDAVGSFLHEVEPKERARIVSGLPDLGRLFADLDVGSPTTLGDPALERMRLFDAVARMLARIAERTPVILFLDDLHWADRTTLALTHYLARGLAGQRAVMLCAYRLGEEGSAQPASLSATLQRAGLCAEVKLPALRDDEVSSLVASMLHATPPTELVTVLRRSALGIPLFVLSIVRALIEDGALVRSQTGWSLLRRSVPVTRDVRALFLARLAPLAETERNLLAIAATAGGAVGRPLLVEVSGLDDSVVTASIEVLIASGLLTETTIDGRVEYQLAHPLLQEVVYAEMPITARRRIHAAFARALERNLSDASGQLALHYREAGIEANPDRALDVLLEVSEQALAVYANDEAATHLQGAVALARNIRPAVLPLLLERLGDARERIGDQTGAVAAWSAALAEHEHDIEWSARIHSSLALAKWRTNDSRGARSEIDAAMRLLADRSISSVHARVYFTAAYLFVHLGDSDATHRASAALREIAIALEAPAVRAQAHLAATFAGRLRGCDYNWAHREARKALRAADESGDRLLSFRAVDTLANMAISAGDHRRGRIYAERGLELAALLGAPSLATMPVWQLSLAGLAGDDWADMLRRCDAGIAQARRFDDLHPLALLLALRTAALALRGEFAAAEATLAEADAVADAAASDDTTVSILRRWAAGVLALERDNPSAAIHHAAEFARSHAMIVAGLGLLGEAQARDGDVEAAVATVGALRATRTSFADAHAARVVALVDASHGLQDKALDGLAHATNAFAAASVVYEEARTRLMWAQLAAAERPADAVEAASQCLVIFECLGMRRYEDRARKLLRDHGVRTPPRRPRRDSQLTPRELEVARLVAEGLTNGEIARRLVVSERTVTTHLSHVYERLQLHSRAALTRFVAESGLLSSVEDT